MTDPVTCCVLLAAYLHQIDPFIFELGNGIGLRWYGMAYLAGAFAGYLLIRRMAAQGRTLLRPDQVGDMVIVLLFGAFIGGRIGYCVFYNPNLLGFMDRFPYWGVLAINEGGMSSHGGMIGIFVAGMYFVWRNKLPLFHVMDLACFAGPIGIAMGRVANFINGELFGRPCPPDYPLAVKFPQEIFAWSAREQAQLADVVPALGIERNEWMRVLDQGDTTAVASAMNEIVAAVQAGNADVIAALSPLLTARYPSQLFQALFEGVLVFVILAIIWSRPRKEGVVASCFVVLYAIGRVVGEQFRMPDAEIGFEWLGLTRGQWLSLAMGAIGVGMLLYFTLRPGPVRSGWRGPIIPAVSPRPR